QIEPISLRVRAIRLAVHQRNAAAEGTRLPRDCADGMRRKAISIWWGNAIRKCRADTPVAVGGNALVNLIQTVAGCAGVRANAGCGKASLRDELLGGADIRPVLTTREREPCL